MDKFLTAVKALQSSLLTLFGVLRQALLWVWFNRGVYSQKLHSAVQSTLGFWRSLTTLERRLLVAAAIVIVAIPTAISWRHVPGHWLQHTLGHRPLNAAKTWHYQLMDMSVEALVKSDADLVVTEYSHSKGDNAGKAWTAAEVARMKQRPNGKTRLAVAYFSIGEAESYRYYWRKDWEDDDDMPGWHVAENCAWPRNHLVRFWHDGWKDIIYRGRKSFLKRIIDAGFDGVYLDRVDVFGELEKERPGVREDMIQFVTELAATARKLKPGFIVMVQNAEDLFEEKRYRDVVDGMGKEDLLFGHDGTNQRNKSKEIAVSKAHIRKLQWDYKPVFAVEYLTEAALIKATSAELQGLGMVPTFAHRSLDGGDPTVPRPPTTIKYGTPEWIKEQCQGKRHW